MSERRRGRTFARYLAFQLPGWVLAFAVLGFLYQGGWMPFWVAASLLGLLALLLPGHDGWVRVGPERWRASLVPGSEALSEDDAVRVREVKGHTLLVEPVRGGEPA